MNDYQYLEKVIMFDKDISQKIIDKIKISDPKYKIKLSAIHYHHQQKEKLDRQLHDELFKLKKQYEKKQFEIIQQQNKYLMSGGTFFFNHQSETHQQFLKNNLNYSRKYTYQRMNDYWVTAIKNCNLLNLQLNEQDLSYAQNLLAIDLQRSENQRGQQYISLIFHFDQNFAELINSTITVSFYMYDSLNAYRQECNAEFRKKNQNDRNYNSFFINFFSSINLEDCITDLSESKDKCKKLGRNFEIAMILKEELIPYSLEYYLNARTIDLQDKGLLNQQMDNLTTQEQQQQLLQQQQQHQQQKTEKSIKQGQQSLQDLDIDQVDLIEKEQNNCQQQ